MDREVIELYLDDIIPNRFQPREVFNEEALKELSASIREHGVIQPIIVRKLGDKYEIIAGERRYKASVLAGLTKIPAIVRNLDDKEASKVALLENLQRKDLTPIEEARTYQKILEIDSMTQEELGKSMGKSQSAIANKMRLLTLPDEVQDALLHDRISERHARSLLNLDTPDKQISMLDKIIKNRLTVRELDNEIKIINGEAESNMNESVVVEELGPKVVVGDPIDEPEEFLHFDFTLPEKEDVIKKQEKEEDKLAKIDFLLKHTNQPKAYTFRDAIDEVKGTASRLKNKGFEIKIDEMDFESTYQIVIKIDKDK